MMLESIKTFPASLMEKRNLVRDGWDRLQTIPFGKQVFSYLVGKVAPYTGNIGAKVVELRPGYAKVELKERTAIRNHLNSIHAIALANLAELAGNIALSYSLPDDARFIVSKMDMDYVKKARGTIYAIGECPIPDSSKRKEYVVNVQILSERDGLLCQAKFHSLVGPKPKATGS